MGYILPVTPYQSIQYANRLQKIMLLFQIVFGLSRKSFDEEFESRSHSLELTPSSVQKRKSFKQQSVYTAS